MLDLISNKRIVLWGVGNTGRTFCEKYENDLEIYACTCNEREFEPIIGLKSVQYDELNIEKDFIIICSIHYNEIEKQLMIRGWEESTNFIRYDVFEELFEVEKKHKKLIIAIGQCEINEICIALKRIKSFKKEYSILYYNERCVCEHGDLFDWIEFKEVINVLGKADFLMLPSVMNPVTKCDLQYIKGFVCSRCRTIVISLFNLDSYWPQDIAAERSINKYYMVKRNEKLCAYVERDQVIEKMIDDNYSASEIMKLILKEDFFDNDVVRVNHENSLKHFRISDKISDIKIFDFVRDNYNTVKLYCDRGHFNENMLREYARRILMYFENNEALKELDNTAVEDIFEHVNELPIYPSTAKILDLKWIGRDTLYRRNVYSGIKLVTFEEYMESFIRYCSEAKRLLCYC